MNETAVQDEKNLPARTERTDKKIMRQENASYSRLREEALDALTEYRRCVNNYDFVSDEKLVDVSIYNIQSAMSRYEFLLNNLKRISDR